MALKQPSPPKQPLQNDAYYPDIPPHLVKCLDKKPKAGESADQMVINRLQTEEEKAACSRAILKWYKDLQVANQKATPK